MHIYICAGGLYIAAPEWKQTFKARRKKHSRQNTHTHSYADDADAHEGWFYVCISCFWRFAPTVLTSCEYLFPINSSAIAYRGIRFISITKGRSARIKSGERFGYTNKPIRVVDSNKSQAQCDRSKRNRSLNNDKSCYVCSVNEDKMRLYCRSYHI